jgi:hypothetical protein
VKIKKFSGKPEDYNWKGDFIALLTLKDLDSILDEDEPEEVEPKKEYKRKSAKVYSYLRLCLDPETARSIQIFNERDGVGAWNRIKKIFEREDPLRMAKIRSELNNIKLVDHDKVEEYLTKINTMVRQIRDVEGVNAFSENSVISAIINGLPDSYEQWIYTTLRDKVGLEEMERELRAISRIKHDRSKNSSSNSGFTAKSRSFHSKRFDKSNLIC